MDADVLVRDYIGRLEAAAWPLAVERRAELAGEVREHIETALAEAGRRDEVTVRNVLERLGPPEEIVAAEAAPNMPSPREDAGLRRGAAAVTSSVGPIEIVALLLLTVGAVLLPFVGALVGLVFVWLSGQWTTRHKVTATGIVVTLLLLPFLLTLFARGA